LHDLRVEAGNDDLVDRFVQNWRTAGLPPATVGALEFAEKLTVSPHQMSQADTLALRRHGLVDADIHDIVQITAYFNYINRVADALGIPPEDFMIPWPREDGGW
jgi:uncharacterized peroxidase-related enzyme